MSVYRSVVISVLSVAASVALLAGCSTSEHPMGQNQSRLDNEDQSGEESVCNNNNDGEHREGENNCENDEREQCGQHEDGQHEDDGEHEHDRCVSLCRDIQPIFDNRCTRCHDAVLLRGGLDLTRGAAYANLVNKPSSPACAAEVPGSIRVVPCHPADSMLWRKTKPDDSRCRMPMPLGSPGLGVIAPLEFALIERWIAQGAQNN